MSEALLSYLSAFDKVSWTQFKDAFDTLDARDGFRFQQPVEMRRLRALRMLESLAHAESCFLGERSVSAATPMLVRLPMRGLPSAILCGARAPGTSSVVKRLSKRLGLEVRMTPQPERTNHLPPRILIEAEDDDGARKLAGELQIIYAAVPAAWTLASAAESLADYVEQLRWTSDGGPNWARDDFDAAHLSFRPSDGKAHGNRLMALVQPVTGQLIHKLVLANQVADVDRDWGRYALLGATGSSVLFYDKAQLLFGAPATCPLPRLFARALTLCSGLTPRVIQYRVPATGQSVNYDLFADVPAAIAEMVASKLNQPLRPVSFQE